MKQTLATYKQAELQVVGYRTIQARVNDVLSEFKINTSQWIILGWVHEHGGVRITTLSGMLRVETPLVTALLHELVNLKLVDIETDRKDKRAKIVNLTPLATKQIPLIEHKLQAALEPLVEGITPDQLSGYFVVLGKIMQNTKPD